MNVDIIGKLRIEVLTLFEPTSHVRDTKLRTKIFNKVDRDRIVCNIIK